MAMQSIVSRFDFLTTTSLGHHQPISRSVASPGAGKFAKNTDSGPRERRWGRRDDCPDDPTVPISLVLERASPGLPLECRQIAQYFGGVPGHVGDGVGLRDDACGVDQIREPLGEVREFMVGFSDHFVCCARRLVDIGQQRVLELLGFSERLVVLGGVERCAEDAAAGVGEVLGPVTQSLSLNRSTGGGGLRIPPKQHPVASAVCEGYRVAVLVGHGEGRGGGACLQHGELRSSFLVADDRCDRRDAKVVPARRYVDRARRRGRARRGSVAPSNSQAANTRHSDCCQRATLLPRGVTVTTKWHGHNNRRR